MAALKRMDPDYSAPAQRRYPTGREGCTFPSHVSGLTGSHVGDTIRLDFRFGETGAGRRCAPTRIGPSGARSPLECVGLVIKSLWKPKTAQTALGSPHPLEVLPWWQSSQSKSQHPTRIQRPPDLLTHPRKPIITTVVRDRARIRP